MNPDIEIRLSTAGYIHMNLFKNHPELLSMTDDYYAHLKSHYYQKEWYLERE